MASNEALIAQLARWQCLVKELFSDYNADVQELMGDEMCDSLTIEYNATAKLLETHIEQFVNVCQTPSGDWIAETPDCLKYAYGKTSYDALENFCKAHGGKHLSIRINETKVWGDGTPY